MSTVNGLRAEGNQVYVSHFRLYYIQSPVTGRPVKTLASNALAKELGILNQALSCGGRTYAKIIRPDGSESVGVGYCNSKDAFSKKEGTRQALERALSSEKLPDIPNPPYVILDQILEHMASSGQCGCGSDSCSNNE